MNEDGQFDLERYQPSQNGHSPSTNGHAPRVTPQQHPAPYSEDFIQGLANRLFQESADRGSTTSHLESEVDAARLFQPSVIPNVVPGIFPGIGPMAGSLPSIGEVNRAMQALPGMRVGMPTIDGLTDQSQADARLEQLLATTPFSWTGELNRFRDPLAWAAPATTAGPRQAEQPLVSEMPSCDRLRQASNVELDRPVAPGLPSGVPAASPLHLGRYYFERPEPSLEQSEASAMPPEPDSFAVHVRRDFPALNQQVHGRPLAWLDNAATAQKPQAVIDAISNYYAHDNSNVHRGAHTLAARATDAYEAARVKVQRFLGAGSPLEVVFVRGATEAINLVAQSWGRQNLSEGDEIVLTEMEHHANIVPWQFVAKERGAKIRVAPFDDSGQIRLEDYAKLLGPRTKLVALTHVSNVLGTILPVELMTAMAHAVGARVLVDGAQAVPHMRPNVQALGSDFYVFSGHKLFGPTGIGALYAREPLLREMPPWQGGGSMIKDVTFEESTFADPPGKFEAGTPIIAGAVGLGAAIDYLDRIGFEAAAAHEKALVDYGMQQLSRISGLRLIGTAPNKVSVLSFVLPGLEPADVATYLDSQGIAVRGGHHCAQPTHRHFGLKASVRPSLAFYNTREEIDRLVSAVAGLAGGSGRSPS